MYNNHVQLVTYAVLVKSQLINGQRNVNATHLHTSHDLYSNKN